MDWKELKAEYVFGNETYAILAQKYGLAERTLAKRAREEHWAEERKDARKQARERARRGSEESSAETAGKRSGEVRFGESDQDESGEVRFEESDGDESGEVHFGETDGDESGEVRFGETDGDESGEVRFGETDGDESGEMRFGETDGGGSSEVRFGDLDGDESSDAQRLASLRRAATLLSERFARAMEDPHLMYRHIGTREREATEFVFETVNGQNMQYIAKALREATAAMRDLYGIATLMEQRDMEMAAQKLALERAKLELERRKADMSERDGVFEFVLPKEVAEWSE